MITVIRLSKPAADLLERVKGEGPILMAKNDPTTQEILSLVAYREWIEIGLEEQFDEQEKIQTQLVEEVTRVQQSLEDNTGMKDYLL